MCLNYSLYFTEEQSKVSKCCACAVHDARRGVSWAAYICLRVANSEFSTSCASVGLESNLNAPIGTLFRLLSLAG